MVVSTHAQVNVIPEPVSVKQPKTTATFGMNPSTGIILEGSNLDNVATFLNDYLDQVYHVQLKVARS